MKRVFSQIFLQVVIFLGVWVSMPAPAWGQTSLGVGDTQTPGGAIVISPQYPKPNETVQVEFSTFEFDKTRARYVWFVNEKRVAEGLGETHTPLMLGGIGSVYTIRVVVTTPDGKAIEKTKIFTVHDIDIAWSAQTYTPPGYRGKPLPSYNSVVHIAAIPHIFINGTRVNPNTLYYQWSMKGSPQKNLAGIGKQNFPVFLAYMFGNLVEVSLKISNADDSVGYEKTISVPIYKGRVILYAFDPLRGPQYQEALQNQMEVSAGKEALFLAAPFNYSLFSLTQTAPTWHIDSVLIPLGEKPFQLVYRSSDNQQATQQVLFEIKNPQSPLETIQKSFVIHVR